ncbi:uncharacterized protein G2W53_012386 [Senna tora]|uniref:Uncharacterized protein n=1 Tax=Senna tora TaxID=362788 RepID=A0A834TWP8_9FABA|nr:uncharacterized protein G2W53_012386 [Senna tora]
MGRSIFIISSTRTPPSWAPSWAQLGLLIPHTNISN